MPAQQELAGRLRAAVSARRGELIALTQELVRERSLLGQEEGAQLLVEARLARLGFALERVQISPPADAPDSTWGYPPLSYDGRTCVVGRIAGSGGGRSLHLSGHVDVVPVDPGAEWQHGPWAGELSGGRIWAGVQVI